MKKRSLVISILLSVAVLVAAGSGFAQAPAPAAKTAPIVVTQVDIKGLAELLKPKGKPLMINFWATWCVPCRDEFPDLVRLHAEYRDRIDLITVSLDDPADIKTYVPKFLAEVKSEMPAYLLRTRNESDAINLVSDKWAGDLPMTVVYAADGSKFYERNGKIRYEQLKTEFDKVLSAKPGQ
jgi:thiol-disulfide isomerase/thioredoxin